MKRNILVGKLLLSGGLLAYLFWKFPLADALAALQATRFFPVAVAVFILLPMGFLDGFQVLCMTRLQAIPVSLRDLIRINLTTSFYSLFLPGVLAGGAVKWYKLSREGKKPAQAAAVVFFNRFLDTFAMVLVGVLFFLPSPVVGELRALKAAALLLLALLLIAYGLLLAPRLLQAIDQRCARLPLPRRVLEKQGKLFEALLRFSRLRFRDHLGLIAIPLLKHGMGVLSFSLLAQSLGLEVSIFQIGWIRSVILLLAMLPVSFAGLGVRETSMVFLLHGFGVQPAEALAFSLLYFLQGILPSLTGGLLELRDFFRKPLSKRSAWAANR
ncbi:MAG: lysylphosphatidylglycerol synthase transmembrane domain-containing protein [Desulfobacteraceae bacterium]|nr:lysylphosphatidylglycerol synthase transmembrane domain-containing protein [Desulfobacteraceae bacterium]